MLLLIIMQLIENIILLTQIHMLCDLFQGRFSAVTYSLIGDDNAPIFFRIDPTFGNIFINSNGGLFADSEIFYRVSCFFMVSLL